jgi:2-deoxy-D-gluconate 3-dehydrogenase
VTRLTPFDLEGRRALITGAGQGLGRALAIGFADAGADLVVCGRREHLLQETADAVKAAGDRDVTIIAADITTEEGVRRLETESGLIDILINNAAIAPSAPWQFVSEQAWLDVVKVNLWAPFRLCQAFAPAMVERSWGRIINISSVYGLMAPRPHLYPSDWDPSSYFATKHGVHGVTRYLAVRLAGSGVCVNTLSPGGIVTSDHRAALSTAEQQRIDAMNQTEVPARRVGTGEDYVAAAVFLASPGAAYVIGHNLVVDGGWSIW